MALRTQKIYLGDTLIGKQYLGNDLILNPVPTWTPENFTGIQHWWRADTGVTEDTGKVTIWEDQINSHQLIQNFTTNPSYTVTERRPSKSTSSNLNSQDTILFETTANATYTTVGDYLYGSTAPTANTAGDDIHLLFVMDFISAPATNPGAPFFGTAIGINVTSRIWVDNFSSGDDYRILNQLGGGGLQTNDTGTPVGTGAQAFWMYYDASAGTTRYALNSVGSTTEATTGSGTDGVIGTDARWSIGALLGNTSGGANLRFNDFHMAEAIVIYGTPTSNDLDSWKEYVNNRYGTIIS